MSGPDSDIIDVQRFGDRLDVLVARARAGRSGSIRRRLEAAGLARRRDPRATSRCSRTPSSRSCARSARRCAIPPFPGPPRVTRICAGRSPSARRDLGKDFGSFRAVHDVSLQVRYGEVYGLLGANGAGKTTTIKMLCGLLDPTRGTVAARGRTAATSVRPNVRQRIGYMSQKFSLYDDLPVDENLAFFAGVYGVPDDERDEKIAVGARVRRPRRTGGPAGRQPAGRLEAARGVRRRHHARAERALPRRADLRRRSARAPRVLEPDQPAGRRWAPRFWSPRTISKKPSSAIVSA